MANVFHLAIHLNVAKCKTSTQNENNTGWTLSVFLKPYESRKAIAYQYALNIILSENKYKKVTCPSNTFV